MRFAVAATTCLLTCAAVAAPADASISPASAIDGPSPDVVAVDGVAMSEDGTGGLVYRKRVDGRVHVFAAQFAGGRWRAPQRVDAGQRFDSSWPAVGAGDDGRLVVTWVQEFGTESDRLFSATIDPGARRFGAPVPIDLNVGEATDTWPDLAMSRGGQAYLTYRVCRDPEKNPTLPPDSVECELRVARYSGQLWSPLGFPANRNAAAPVSTPDADNRPRIAIEPGGNAVLAFSERDDEFIDRVWARRVFGSTLGAPLLVSPQTISGRPLRAPADQFDLDVAGFGQATVAFRQQGTRTGPQRQARVWAATLPESFDEKAAAFGAPRPVDGFGTGEPPAAPGPVSVAGAPAGAFTTAFGIGVEALFVASDDKTVGERERLDRGGSTEPPDPQIDLSPTGALAAAYRLRSAGRTQLELYERRADGIPDRRVIAAPGGGAIGAFELAGSGLGDALVGWRQGPATAGTVTGAVIDAPPGEFVVQTPADFTRARGRYLLRWDPAPSAVSGVRYSVLVDDEELADGLAGTRRQIDLGRLDDGAIEVRVVARDGAGQETESTAASLKLDRRAPRIALQQRRGTRLRVVVRDGARGQVAGADHAATRITWGDGRRAEGREGAAAVTHHYRRAGTYRLTATVRDLAGNRRRHVRRVTVR